MEPETLDDVLKRGRLLRERMSNAVLVYDHPPSFEDTAFSTENTTKERLNRTESSNQESNQESNKESSTRANASGVDQIGVASGRLESSAASSTYAHLPLDELLAHVEKHVLNDEGGDRNGMRPSQATRSMSNEVPVDSVVALSPEFNDRTLTDSQLEELVVLTRPAEEEFGRLSRPYPSLEECHDVRTFFLFDNFLRTNFLTHYFLLFLSNYFIRECRTC